MSIFARKAFGFAWVVLLLAVMVSVAWQQWPLLTEPIRTGGNPDFASMLRLDRALMLRPVNLVPWILLVVSGLAAVLPRRKNWPEERGSFFLFLALTFSVAWFLLIVIFVR
ncbi:MAG TPA: hypothetical protein VLY23_17570 [Candidatus Acidoferrum sp.]|nr:hypothetical protein [Candidatus Acidoferrum sp.]